MTRTSKAILVGGLVAGALDLTYAFIVYGPLSYHMSPVQVLQSVAAGWLGHDAASSGGAGAAALGFATHFMIAVAMAMVFVLSSQRLPALKVNAVTWGLIYGLGLYVVMNYVVVPLSAAHRSQHFPADFAEAIERLQVAFSAVRPKDRWQLFGTVLTHTVFVGLPIALINRRVAQATGIVTARPERG